MHLVDLKVGVMGTSAIVGGTMSHAAGAALTFRMKGKDSVAVVSLGDGAVEEGVFHETLNFSALRRLPVVFVCENNLYATNTHIRDRQAQPEIYRHAERLGLPGVVADGNDVLVVHAEAEKAVARARKGQGPTLLEFQTYRILEHCGINEDHELGYRTLDEVRQWQARGPLEKGKHLVTEAEVKKMVVEIDTRIDHAFQYARSSPWPTALFPEGVAR